jgi:hypothetical protein
MGRIMDIADEWERNRQKAARGTIDGHVVEKIVWQTDKMVIFRDPDGRLWRRVDSWGVTWPVVVEGAGDRGGTAAAPQDRNLPSDEGQQ